MTKLRGSFLDAVAGIAAILLGIYLFVSPRTAVELLVLLIAGFMVIKGVAMVFKAIGARDDTRGWRIVGGLLAIVAGLVGLGFD